VQHTASSAALSSGRKCSSAAAESAAQQEPPYSILSLCVFLYALLASGGCCSCLPAPTATAQDAVLRARQDKKQEQESQQPTNEGGLQQRNTVSDSVR
jgi:hypothetical protein